MPKRILQPNENVKKVHPFRATYAKLAQSIEDTRNSIMNVTGWSESTFYRKVSNDERLTEREAKVVSSILNIPINTIDEYQRGYKVKAVNQ